jgi:DnaJ-class molecular chaperone
MKCKTCVGEGNHYDDETGIETCPDCGGKGIATFESAFEEEVCNKCMLPNCKNVIGQKDCFIEYLKKKLEG